MAIIEVETPKGLVEVEIAGDKPTEEELNIIRQELFSQPQKRTSSSFQDLLDQQSGLTEQKQEPEQLFDTTTGIKDAGLRAALSAAENNKEQENILNNFGLDSIDFTRDKRNRLALTPTGAKKFGVETDKNVLIDESGFSRYDFADLAGILPELTGAVGGALKGAAVGTAVAPGIGTLLFGAAGAALGGGGGSLAEEAIEGLAGVSEQTAGEIAKDAGKEALIAGGAELLFGAPFLAFRALRPKAGILKEGDSEAVETVKKAVDMDFAPSGRQLGVSPIRAKTESLVESVLGSSPRLSANRVAMNKQIDKYKTKLAEFTSQSGAKDAGEIFVNLSKQNLAALNRANLDAQNAIIKAMKDSSESLAGSLRTNSSINDDLYNAVSDVFKAFDEKTSNAFKDIDAVIESSIGTRKILPTDSLSVFRQSALNKFADNNINNLGDSLQDTAVRFLVDSFNTKNMGKKASFSKLYEVRKKLFNIRNGDARNLDEAVVKAINGTGTLTRLYDDALESVDNILSDSKITSLTDDITSVVGKEGFEKISKAAKQLGPARNFYREGIKEFESVAASMGSKGILESIRNGVRPENMSGFAMNMIKNNKAQPLLNLKAALKNDDTYNSLKKEMGDEWIRTTLKTSGFDSVDSKLFKPSAFVKALDELGETGDELFGAANYAKYKNIAKGFDEVATSEINEELISKAVAAGLDQSIEGALKNSIRLAKDLGEAQKNSVLRKIRNKNLTPDEASKVVAAPGVTVNELKYIIDYLKKNDVEGLNSVRKYYTQQMFDGLGATVNAKTLSDMSKTVQKFDGDFKKLNIVFDAETAQGMRDFGKVLGFISKDVGNSDLVANSITANFMGAIGKIARIGIIGNLFTNKRAIQQIKDLDNATKGLPKQKRGELMATAIGAFVRQSAAQTLDTGVSETVDQTTSLVKNTFNEALQNQQNQQNTAINNLANQVNVATTQNRNILNQPTQPSVTQPSGLIDRVLNQAQEIRQNNIRQRAATNPAVAASLLGGLGSASLLD